MTHDADARPSHDAAQLVVPCPDLDVAIAFYEELGFRLDMIMPADAPRIAVVSGHGIALRLIAIDAAAQGALKLRIASRHARHGALCAPGGLQIELAEPDALHIPEGRQEFVIARASDTAWVKGRAGMEYRDLIPGRCGGRFIASHIRIPQSGPVADYVHHHAVRFQMIYCRRGWVRVVYEDQGPPFLMQTGDCVLQPPGIRHRVLESSAGLEVIEIASPAEHETWRDHALDLPTQGLRPERVFSGQRFVRHVAANAEWRLGGDGRFDIRDTGIAHATSALASVRVLRSPASGGATWFVHKGELLFLAILEGSVRLQSETFGSHTLGADDACIVPGGADVAITANAPCEVLELALPPNPDDR